MISSTRAAGSIRVLALSGLFACALTAAGAFPAAAPAAAAHKATPQLIERDLRAGKIGSETGTLYLAYALARPGKLPAPYRSDTPWDGTLPLLDLRAALKRMRPGPRREELQDILSPAVVASSGTCSTSNGSLPNDTQTDHFYVQYGTVGAGLTINSYLESLEGSWAKEVTSFGWAAPPVAATPAPGSKYHVRLDSLGSGLYGYVSSSGTHAGAVGNNPNTPWNEGDAFASCMVLNRDYSGFPSTPQASLDSTTAHEFNHSLQFGYGALTGTNAPDDVLVEGGATWMEDEVYDGADDNHNYLWPAFADSMGDYDSSPYPYWITLRGLTERYGTGSPGGGEQVMQDFWEETSKNTGNDLTALQTALGNRGTTLAAAFHAYAIAVKFNKPCGAGYVYPYCLEEGAAYIAAAGATAAHKTISSVGGSTTNATIEDNYALNWVSLPGTGGPYDVTLENTSSGGQLRGTLACDTGSALSLSPLPATVASNADTVLSGFNPTACSGAPVLVITNQSQTAANPTNSSERSYKVSTTSTPPSPVDHMLTVSTSGSGTVASNPAGISCGADCSETFSSATTVTLTATSSVGSTFSGWGGACSGSNSTCTVNMTQDRTVTATFLPRYPLTVSKTGSGTVTSNPSGINCGADCSQDYTEGTGVVLSAIPVAGWSFSGWSGACTGQACAVTMDAAKSVTATFTQDTETHPTPVDDVPPDQGKLRLSVTSFRAVGSGPSVASASVGASVSFALSEPATTRFRVERAAIGRLVGGRCVRTTRFNADRRRCTRYVLMRGMFSLAGRAGINRFRFTGRLSGRTLRPWRYRLLAMSTDSAGNRSATSRARFRIID